MKKFVFLTILCLNTFLFAEKTYLYLPFSERNIEVSSYLKESDTEYCASNLSPVKDLPWVTAGGNNGENSKITIKNCNTNELYISIGFVKEGRNDLYYKNSRPKIVNVYFTNLKKSKSYELKDTPEPQKIVLSDTQSNLGTIELTFPKVYEGTKYKDLCINFLSPKREVKDEKVYTGLQKINKELQDKKCYVRILPTDVEAWRPGEKFLACPIESEVLFKYSHCEDFVRELGDCIGVDRLLFEKYIFPEFKENNIEAKDIQYEEYEDIVTSVTFTISSVKYCMGIWIYTEDYLLIDFFIK